MIVHLPYTKRLVTHTHTQPQVDPIQTNVSISSWSDYGGHAHISMSIFTTLGLQEYKEFFYTSDVFKGVWHEDKHIGVSIVGRGGRGEKEISDLSN